MTGKYHYEGVTADCLTRFREYLTQQGCSSGLQDIFWLTVPEQYLSAHQKEHLQECGPYLLALEVEETSVTIEMLVRASNALHCSCTGPASATLRAYALSWLDDALSPL